MIQVVVQSNDVLPRAVVLRACGDVQVLDDIVVLLDGVFRALGDVGEILTGGTVLFQITAIERLCAGTDLVIEIFEQVVVFAQATVEVLLGEGRLAAILVIIVVIVKKAIGSSRGLRSSSSTSWCSLVISAVVCVAALSKGLITKKMTKAMIIATSTTITAISALVLLFLAAGACGESGAYVDAGCCWGGVSATGMRCVVSTAAGLAAGSGR